MKKLLIASLALVGFGLSGFASAAGTLVPSEDITPTDCALLAESVKLNLSSNVTGAYQCDTGAAAIRIATCHAAGSRTDSVTCTDTDTETDGMQSPISECSSADDGDIVTLTTPDFSGFYGTSRGGSISKLPLGGACDDSTIVNLGDFE